MYKLLISAVLVLFVFIQSACGFTSRTLDESGSSPLDNFEENSEALYEAYTKNQSPLAGNWFTSLNYKFPLIIRVEEDAVGMIWAVTLDSDIQIMGDIPKVSENIYSGPIHWVAGDELGSDVLTLTFFPEKELMDFNFPAFFEEPVVFSKTQEVLSENLPSCSDVAERMLTDSRILADLNEKNPGDQPLSFMEESSDEVLMTYDFRIYREGVDGEIVTIDRIRYDFQNQKLLNYDPVEDEYVDIPNMGILMFDECRG